MNSRRDTSMVSSALVVERLSRPWAGGDGGTRGGGWQPARVADCRGEGAVEAPSDSLRRDHDADPALRAVVARERVPHLLRGEALVLRASGEQVVEARAAIVERAEAAGPEIRRLQDLVEQVHHLLL